MKSKTLFSDGIDYAQYNTNDELCELVNLSINGTGIEGSIRCISKLADLEPHIIHFQDIHNDKEILVVSVPEGNIITDTSKIDEITKRMVQQFAIQNAETLLRYWNEATYWYLEELRDTMRNLNKIDASKFT